MLCRMPCWLGLSDAFFTVTPGLWAIGGSQQSRSALLTSYGGGGMCLPHDRMVKSILNTWPKYCLPGFPTESDPVLLLPTLLFGSKSLSAVPPPLTEEGSGEN